MKKLQNSLFLYLFSVITCFSQQTKTLYNIHFSPLVEQRKSNVAEVNFNKSLNTLITFINTGYESDSLLYDKTLTTDQKNIFKELFFLTNLPKEYSHYYILSVDSIPQGYLFKISNRQSNEEFKYDQIFFFCNILVKNDLVDISYKNNLKDYTSIKKKQITYYIKNKKDFNNAKANKALAFCDSVKQILAIKELHPLNYILSKKGKAPEIFGFDYFWSPFGVFMHDDILLSNGMGENYRHELVHYITQDYKLNKWTNEGLAVWFAGSQNESYKTFVSGRFVVNGVPTNEQIKNVFTSKKQTVDSFKYLYSLSAVYVDLIYDEKGINGIRQLLSNSKKYFDLNPLEIMVDILGEKENDLVEKIHNKCTQFTR